MRIIVYNNREGILLKGFIAKQLYMTGLTDVLYFRNPIIYCF